MKTTVSPESLGHTKGAAVGVGVGVGEGVAVGVGVGVAVGVGVGVAAGVGVGVGVDVGVGVGVGVGDGVGVGVGVGDGVGEGVGVGLGVGVGVEPKFALSLVGADTSIQVSEPFGTRAILALSAVIAYVTSSTTVPSKLSKRMVPLLTTGKSVTLLSKTMYPPAAIVVSKPM